MKREIERRAAIDRSFGPDIAFMPVDDALNRSESWPGTQMCLPAHGPNGGIADTPSKGKPSPLPQRLGGAQVRASRLETIEGLRGPCSQRLGSDPCWKLERRFCNVP